MTEPYISVIISAFNRRNYLRDAVASVKRQTLGVDHFEVIFLTNFEVEPELLVDLNSRQLHSSEREGPAIAYAIEEAVGEIVCFLDDDDIWESTKLESVYSQFRTDLTIGYYHNNISVINEQGGVSKSPIYRSGINKMSKLQRIEVDATKATFRDIRRLVNLAIDFNNSSISILRSVLLKRLEELRTSYSSMDTFFFYSALASNYKIVGDGTILTKYRLHSKNTSGASSFSEVTLPRESMYMKGKSEFNKKVTSQHRHLLQTLGPCSQAIKRSIECVIADDVLESYWLGNIVHRRVMLIDILHYLKYLSRYEFGYNLKLIIFSLTYLLMPTTAQRMFLRRYYEPLE